MRTRTAALLAALPLIAVGLSACAAAQASLPAPEAALAREGIVVGDGAVEVTLWGDPSCPHCKLLDEEISPALAAAIDEGAVSLTLHPMTYVSEKRGDATDYSTRGAALLLAAAGAGELDAVPALYGLIQRHQVSDAGAPSDDELLGFAADAGIEADLSSAFDEYASLATAANDAWLGEEIPGTDVVVDHVPLLVIDGEVFEVREDGTDGARFADALETAG